MTDTAPIVDNVTTESIIALADDMVREFTANIPLTPPDPQLDPNDEFRRCAIDRADRAKKYAARLKDLATALSTQHETQTITTKEEADALAPDTVVLATVMEGPIVRRGAFQKNAWGSWHGAGASDHVYVTPPLPAVVMTTGRVDLVPAQQMRTELAKVWSAWLDLAMSTYLSDDHRQAGESMLQTVMIHNPELAADFKRALAVAAPAGE